MEKQVPMRITDAYILMSKHHTWPCYNIVVGSYSTVELAYEGALRETNEELVEWRSQTKQSSRLLPPLSRTGPPWELIREQIDTMREVVFDMGQRVFKIHITQHHEKEDSQ